MHVAPWGAYITTPEISASQAAVRVRTTLQNDESFSQALTVRTTLLNPAGQAVASTETRQNLQPRGLIRL